MHVQLRSDGVRGQALALDTLGREVDYLRIGLTEACSLACAYCQPSGGSCEADHHGHLERSDLVRIVEAAVSVGFRRFRLTGGEPTLRPDLCEIVAELAGIPGVEDLALTTNGLTLAAWAEPLWRAGLQRVNVHLDSLRDQPLRGAPAHARDLVWRGLTEAERVGLRPIKINCALSGDGTAEDWIDLARLTLQNDWHVRFIELMPFASSAGRPSSAINGPCCAQVRRAITAALGPMSRTPALDGNGVARMYRLDGARGAVGFIAPMSEPFCQACRRMRLTPDGRLRMCLLADDEINIQPWLSSRGTTSAGTATLAKLIEEAVRRKPARHHMQPGGATCQRPMSHVGG